QAPSCSNSQYHLAVAGGSISNKRAYRRGAPLPDYTALKLITLVVLLFGCTSVANAALKLTPHQIKLANGKSFTLNLPENFDIIPAVQGLKRVRFMAKSPDNRLFVTDMFDLSDN